MRRWETSSNRTFPARVRSSSDRLSNGFVPPLAPALQALLGDTVGVIGLFFAAIVAMTAVPDAMVKRRLQRS